MNIAETITYLTSSPANSNILVILTVDGISAGFLGHKLELVDNGFVLGISSVQTREKLMSLKNELAIITQLVK